MSRNRNVYDVQHDFALSCGLKSEIIWDSLSPDQSDILIKKIHNLIPDTANNNQNIIKRMREDLFKNVWLQRKYTNRVLLSSIIYVMVTNETTDQSLALQSTKFSCHPVIRTRKCIKKNSNDSAGCCMIFIDDRSRVYNNWREYLQQNQLPAGIMIAPADGIYSFDDNDEMKLDIRMTPALSKSSKILNTTDKVATVTGLAAGVGGLVAVPLAAAVTVPLASMALMTAAYSTVRSMMQLNDRRKHQQTIALSNADARNNWFGVMGGVVGLSASGATKAMTYAAGVGREINMVTKVTVNTLNVSSILISGSGVVSGVYDLYLKINNDQKLTSIDVLQLSSSLIIFTHSLNNFRMASKIATKSGKSPTNVLLRKEIGNGLLKIKKSYNNNASDVAPRRFDIIRAFNNVPLREVLMNLHTMNPKLGIAKDVMFSDIATKIELDDNGGVLNKAELIQEFGLKFVQFIINPGAMQDVLKAMATYLCESTVRFLVNLAASVITELDSSTSDTFISSESVLFKIFMDCVKTYTNFDYDYLKSNSIEILHKIENYLQSLNPRNVNDEPRQCSQCGGQFFISKL